MDIHARLYGLSLLVALTFVAGTQAQDERATTIVVSLPAEAMLTINGRATSAQGEQREFRDSQVAPGRVYRYELQATVERNGRTIAQSKSLRIIGGEAEQVRFEFPNVVAARKPTVENSELIAQADQFQPRFQPLPGPASDLPELPAQGEPTGDRFQPRTPDLSEPPAVRPAPTEFDLPELDEPASGSRFGRQFGEEPDSQPAGPSSDLTPPVQPLAPLQPATPVRPVEPLPATDDLPSDDGEVEAKSHAEKPAAAPPKKSAAPVAVAYIGNRHQHHLLGEMGTALHHWQHGYRLVELMKTSHAGPYVLYRETDRDDFLWGYGLQPFGCQGHPVFFKPGSAARWQFLGYAQQVRSIGQ